MSRVQGAFTYNASYDKETSSFIPIEGFVPALKEHDLFLVFLSANNILYTSMINDTWYAAHRFLHTLQEADNSFAGTSNTYLADEPASPLGCTAHYELCSQSSTSTQICQASRAAGGYCDLGNCPDKMPTPSNISEAYSITQWLFASFQDLPTILQTLASTSLTSRNSLLGGLQASLPDDQWQLEVENWFNISLVSLQSIVDLAIGANDPDIQQYFWEGPNAFQRENICGNQVRKVNIF